MSNPWFRMYSEFAHDPKVQMMSEAMQRRYMMVLCLRCGNTLVTLHETEIAFHLRITDADLAETKALFVTKGFIDEQWNVLNWEKRQFKSDSSAERVARHRRSKKQERNDDVTLQKRQSNAIDTETDTDTETEKNKTPAPKPARFDPRDLAMPLGLKAAKWDEWVAYRSKIGKTPKRETWTKQLEFLADCISGGSDPASIIDESIRNGWQGLFVPKTRSHAPPKYESEKDRSRRETIEGLTGMRRNEPSSDERDITAFAERVD